MLCEVARRQECRPQPACPPPPQGREATSGAVAASPKLTQAAPGGVREEKVKFGPKPSNLHPILPRRTREGFVTRGRFPSLPPVPAEQKRLIFNFIPRLCPSNHMKGK